MPQTLAATTQQAHALRAGPLRMKLQDGQLRYICLGNRELVRRVYFAVRDKDFDTPPAVFSQMDVQARADSFTVQFAATCHNDHSDFAWKGSIEGDANGRIVFRIDGAATRDFRSPRIGITALYGNAAVGGYKFFRQAAGA